MKLAAPLFGLIVVGFFATTTLACSGSDDESSTENTANSSSPKDAQVVGVYEAALTADAKPDMIARLALAEGQYMLFSADCVRTKAQGCEREGTFSIDRARDLIELVDNKDGSKSSFPFSVISSKMVDSKANNGTMLTPKGICIGTQSECEARRQSGQGGQGVLVTPAEAPVVNPNQILIQCRGNCAMTIRMNGQELTTTGQELNVTVPAPAPNP